MSTGIEPHLIDVAIESELKDEAASDADESDTAIHSDEVNRSD